MFAQILIYTQMLLLLITLLFARSAKKKSDRLTQMIGLREKEKEKLSTYTKLKLLNRYPSYLTCKDMICLEIFCSSNAIYHAKRKGRVPKHIILSDKSIRFLKEDVIRWIKEKETKEILKNEDL